MLYTTFGEMCLANGATKGQITVTLEAARHAANKRNDFHGKIYEDSSIIDPNTGEVIGNINDFLP